MSKKKKKKYKQSSRVWLNADQSMRAHAIWVVESSEYSGYVNAEFTLGDCYRNVTIDCSYETLKERKAAITKMDKLVSEVLRFQAALKDAPIG